MRVLTSKEMKSLYKITRAGFVAGGIGLIGYGSLLISPLLDGIGTELSWLGVFPVYIGAMMLLVAAAMKEDWFTNARKYW